MPYQVEKAIAIIGFIFSILAGFGSGIAVAAVLRNDVSNLNVAVFGDGRPGSSLDARLAVLQQGQNDIMKLLLRK